MSNTALNCLQRMEAEDIGEATPLRGELPQEAASLLGYKVLQKERERAKILGVLKDLNSLPFESSSVFNYKQQIINQTAPPWYSKIVTAITAIGFLGFMLSFGPAVLGWLVSWQISLYSAIVLVASCVVIGCLANTAFGIKEKGSWQVTPLERCREEIPIFALSLAVSIKKELPEARFCVHQFIQERLLDPFLVVNYGEADYFIAVWNESDFEAAREI
jgi:hypothetical protein